MKTKKADLKTAAAFLGKSTRQVRRMVATGLLPSSGGGHGVPLTFDLADLERVNESRKVYRPRREWPGAVKGDLLGRIAAGYAARSLPWWEATMLFKWAECGAHRAHDEQERNAWRMQHEHAVQRAFPPLDQVPERITIWAANAQQYLNAQEVDFIAAMFVVAGLPWSEYSDADRAAVADLRVRALAVPINDSKRIVGSVFDGAHDEEFNQRVDALGMDIEYKSAGNDLHSTQDLRSASHKLGKDRRRRYQGKPTVSKVCVLLGLHRAQGARVVSAIKKKLPASILAETFNLLGVEFVPRGWKSKTAPAPRAPIKKEVQELVCTSCGEPVDSDAETCPACSALL